MFNLEKEMRQLVFTTISNLLEDPTHIDQDTILMDILDSMMIVTLCLNLEDEADNLGFEFDWKSDTTLSRNRSMFKTAGSLSEEFIRQFREHK